MLALGQDGLVANVAKYLDGQPVIGLNPEPERFPGVLVSHPPEAVGDLCADLVAGRAGFEQRTMVRARLDDGQALLALNEIFVGHRTPPVRPLPARRRRARASTSPRPG